MHAWKGGLLDGGKLCVIEKCLDLFCVREAETHPCTPGKKCVMQVCLCVCVWLCLWFVVCKYVSVFLLLVSVGVFAIAFAFVGKSFCVRVSFVCVGVHAHVCVHIYKCVCVLVEFGCVHLGNGGGCVTEFLCAAHESLSLMQQCA